MLIMSISLGAAISSPLWGVLGIPLRMH